MDCAYNVNINKLFKACLHVVYLRFRSIIVVWEVLLLLLDFSKGDMNSMSSVAIMFKH